MPISERYLPRKWSTATLVPLRSARLRNDGIYVRPIARINIGATTSAMARFGRMYIAVSLGAWELICEMAPRFGNPAINWNTSYSEYVNDLSAWYYDNAGPEFMNYRDELCSILLEENSLMEIVKLIGADVLPDDQKLVIEIARVIRVGFLQQNAFHKEDTYVPLAKQMKMMEIILYLYHQCREVVAKQVPISKITKLGLFDKLVKIKYDVPNDRLDMFDDYRTEIDKALAPLLR